MKQETRNVILICLLLILALLLSLMITSDSNKVREIKATSDSPAVPFLFKDEQKTLRLSVTTTTIPPTTTTLPLPTVRKTKSKPKPIIHEASQSRNINWDAIANCESHGNWSINTGNGYYGGLQFSHATWIAFGGRRFAEYAHLTSRENQIVIASKMALSNWPHCGKYG